MASLRLSLNSVPWTRPCPGKNGYYRTILACSRSSTPGPFHADISGLEPNVTNMFSYIQAKTSCHSVRPTSNPTTFVRGWYFTGQETSIRLKVLHARNALQYDRSLTGRSWFHRYQSNLTQTVDLRIQVGDLSKTPKLQNTCDGSRPQCKYARRRCLYKTEAG